MIKKLLFLGLFLSLLFSKEIKLAASANTMYAIKSLIKEFKKTHPNTDIKVILASSGKLTAQIMHGAPYDLFLSANMKYPYTLYKKGFGIEAPKVYAKGAICLLSFKHKNLSNLKHYQIAIANPKTAPYGMAAVEAFKNEGIYNDIKNNLIYAESVSGVVPYVMNFADVGVVAKSILFSLKDKNIKFYSKDINLNLYTPINQGALLLNKNAKEFYEFLFTKSAKDIFKKYGYQ